MLKVHTVTQKLLNVLIGFFSVFYAGMVIFFIYAAFAPSIALTYYTSPGISLVGLISVLILVGSTVYYFKTEQKIMKVVSSVGCFAVLIFLVIIYVF